MAGLASSIMSGKHIMIDDTPPTHATARLCTPGGRHGADGVFNQASEEALTVCWPAPGFVDHESGVWHIEWQLARWTGAVWDTLGSTQQLDETETKALVGGGVLNFTKARQHGQTRVASNLGVDAVSCTRFA